MRRARYEARATLRAADEAAFAALSAFLQQHYGVLRGADELLARVLARRQRPGERVAAYLADARDLAEEMSRRQRLDAG